jgi:hypothetical protein
VRTTVLILLPLVLAWFLMPADSGSPKAASRATQANGQLGGTFPGGGKAGTTRSPTTTAKPKPAATTQPRTATANRNPATTMKPPAAGDNPAKATEPTSTSTVMASADTYVVTEQPQTVFGAAIKIAASNWSTPWHSQAYMRFKVPAPPAGSSVLAARIKLTFVRLDNRPNTVELRSVASTSWSELTTNYATRPAVGDVVSIAAINSSATTLSIDVTSALGGSSGARSFALTNPTAETAVSFYSREHGADGPRLVVTYQPTRQT